jgi:negative regulator of flagellin synthesis FlgM
MAVSPVGAARPAEAIESGGAAAGVSTPAAEISISAHARNLASEGAGGAFDPQKVEALKNRIAEGTFKIDSQDVARRMLEALG